MQLWHIDGKAMISRETIDAVDAKEKSITYKLLEGDIMKLFKTSSGGHSRAPTNIVVPPTQTRELRYSAIHEVDINKHMTKQINDITCPEDFRGTTFVVRLGSTSPVRIMAYLSDPLWESGRARTKLWGSTPDGTHVSPVGACALRTFKLNTVTATAHGRLPHRRLPMELGSVGLPTEICRFCRLTRDGGGGEIVVVESRLWRNLREGIEGFDKIRERFERNDEICTVPMVASWCGRRSSMVVGMSYIQIKNIIPIILRLCIFYSSNIFLEMVEKE
ncbi:hypothetical protein LguiB_026279 [Lonicera macranthoides]